MFYPKPDIVVGARMIENWPDIIKWWSLNINLTETPSANEDASTNKRAVKKLATIQDPAAAAAWCTFKPARHAKQNYTN